MYEKLFEEGVDRRGTCCVKWDQRESTFHNADAIPLSVADMDFAAPQEVSDAIIERAQHGAFGYTLEMPGEKQAVVDWMKNRHQTAIQESWITFSPGVINSMRVALGILTRPGDKVVIQPPVYSPFGVSVQLCGCEVRKNRLKKTDEGWKMDLVDLENAFQEGARVLILCNPHNPVGRVWGREELLELVNLCKKYSVQIICDEIHADLELPGHKTTSLIGLDQQAIVFISATKTFNLAALSHSSVLIADDQLRERFCQRATATGAATSNLFGRIAQMTAYQKGAAWLDELLAYIDANRRFVEGFLAAELPQFTASRLEGTYLMWLDLHALSMPHDDVVAFCHQAGLGVVSGTAYGEEGDHYVRVNLATPRRNLEQAFAQFKAAVDRLA